eukprot:768682-Hanusia_phi.AAC.4
MEDYSNSPSFLPQYFLDHAKCMLNFTRQLTHPHLKSIVSFPSHSDKAAADAARTNELAFHSLIARSSRSPSKSRMMDLYVTIEFPSLTTPRRTMEPLSPRRRHCHCVKACRRATPVVPQLCPLTCSPADRSQLRSDVRMTSQQSPASTIWILKLVEVDEELGDVESVNVKNPVPSLLERKVMRQRAGERR